MENMEPETQVVTFDGGGKRSFIFLPGMWRNWRHDAKIDPDSTFCKAFRVGYNVPREQMLDVLFSPYKADEENNKVHVVLAISVIEAVNAHRERLEKDEKYKERIAQYG